MSLDPQIDSMSLDELADFEPSPAEPSRPFTGPRPSRSSTCFSALTMTSSDDAFVEDEADPSSGWAELDSMELDEEEEDQSDSALVVHDGPAEDDDSLPELAFSSDEDTTSPESASPEWPRRTSIGEAINSDEELLLFADLGPDEDTLGGEFGESIWANDSFKQSTASYAAEEERPGAKETGPPMLDIDGVGATEERTPAPPAASSLRWRQLEAESLSGLNACKTRSDTGGDNEAVSEPPPAKVDTPGSPTQAQMDAFFGFVPKTSSVQAPPTSEPPRARQQIEAKTASPPPVQPSGRSPSPGEVRAPIPTPPVEIQPTTSLAARRVVRTQRYYQLEPIPAVSPATGRALSEQEKKQVPAPLLKSLGLIRKLPVAEQLSSQLSRRLRFLCCDRSPTAFFRLSLSTRRNRKSATERRRPKFRPH